MSPEAFIGFFSNVWNWVFALFFFGASIFIHELGHFLAALKRGLKVERFSIGFGPRLFGWRRNGVDYRISLLPLGGYVALPQLADMGRVEGGETEEEARRLPPITFSDKVIVAAAGPAFNIAFAFLIACLLWVVGQPTQEENESTLVGYVAESLQLSDGSTVAGPAAVAGLLEGDRILRVDGRRVRNFREIQQRIITGSGVNAAGNPEVVLTVERAGEPIELTVNPLRLETNRRSGDRLRQIGIQPGYTVVVQQIQESSPAERAGLQAGDVILSANGTPLSSLPSLTRIIRNRDGAPVELLVEREGRTRVLPIEPVSIPFRRPVAYLQWLGTEDPGHVLLAAFFDDLQQRDPTDPAALAEIRVQDVQRVGGSPLRRVRSGDVLVGIGDRRIDSMAALHSALSERANGVLQSEWDRNGEPYTLDLPASDLSLSLTPAATRDLIGFSIGNRRVIVHVDPFRQFREKVDTTFSILGSLLTPSSDIELRHLSGPPGIVRVLHEFSTIDLRLVLWFVVLLNINLAILNLLPIPVLDGGHILFATIAKLRGKSLPLTFIGATQSLFMILLFSLIIYVSFFDVRRWQGDAETDRDIRIQETLFLETVFPPASASDGD